MKFDQKSPYQKIFEFTIKTFWHIENFFTPPESFYNKVSATKRDAPFGASFSAVRYPFTVYRLSHLMNPKVLTRG